MGETVTPLDFADPPTDWRRTSLGTFIDEEVLYAKNGFPQGKHNQSGAGVPHLRPFNVSEDG
jgi:type I restriction enzyme S subunit